MPLHLSYTAPPGCPDRAAVVKMIAEHAPHTDDPRELAIAISRDGDDLRGALTIAGATREVGGSTCAEVVAAVALVAALAIEEQAKPPELVHHATWQLAVGAGVGVFTGMAPSARIGAPIFVAAAREHGPAFRIAFDVTTRDDVTGEAGSTSFRWLAGRIDGCPHVWSAGAFELAPCLGLEAGAIEARGVGIAMATTNDRPWITPQAILRLGVHLGPATLGAEGSIGAPIVRDTFLVAPDVTIYSVPAISTNLALTLAIDF